MPEWIFHPVVLAGLTLVAAFLATWAHYRFWVRRLTVPMHYARFERLKTDDGAAIELRRLPPPPNPEAPPVLLVHGLAANHRNLDAEPHRSLARVLGAAGRDVWLVTLRSGRADRSFREPPPTLTAMVRHDLPRAISRILEMTYADRIDYVGFSMGGVLLFAALGGHLDPRLLRRVVIVGSPGVIHAPYTWLPKLPRFIRRWLPSLPLRFLARFFAFAAEAVPVTPIHRWVCNPANLAPGSARRAMVNLIEDVTPAQGRDVVNWVLDGALYPVKGVRLLDRLADIRIPALFVAGAADRLAPPASVSVAYDAWGARTEAPKQMMVVGRSQGAQADYGHGDLVVGREVVDDVFVPVRDFLSQD